LTFNIFYFKFSEKFTIPKKFYLNNLPLLYLCLNSISSIESSSDELSSSTIGICATIFVVATGTELVGNNGGGGTGCLTGTGLGGNLAGEAARAIKDFCPY
jgi:hypothetical protein